MRLPKILFLAVGFGLTTLRADHIAITVGDGTINGDRFQPYTNKWEYSITPLGKDKVKLGIWADEMVATTVDGRAAFSRMQTAGRYASPGKTVITINVFDAHTLAPLSREWIAPDPENFTRLKFDGKTIAIERMSSGGRQGPNAPQPAPAAAATELKLDAPVFDYHGGMWGMLLAGAPLKVGFEGSFQTLDEFNPTVSPVKFKVVREEDVAAGAGRTAHTFVVEADSPKSGHLIFWISPQAPYVIKLQFTGGNGALWSYDMI